MKTGLLFIVVLCASVALAQAQPAIAASEDISGMYTFLHDGEFVQIDIDGSRVTGFVSRLGDSDSNRGAFLDHMFKEGELKGDEIHFVTRQVHGVSYEFTGKVARGEEKDPAKEGYRVLKGKLTQTSDDENQKASAKSGEVTLKSFPMGDLLNKSK